MQRVLGLLAVLPAIALASPVWKGDFETGDLSQWSKQQMVSADRLSVVSNPVHQGKYALKATVKQGDNPIGASGNRNELVYETTNPEGSEYYYRWSTMFSPDYPSESTWQVFTQFHQSGCCGSPPVEFDIYGEKITLTLSEHDVWSAPLERGKWHEFIFHVKWSNDPNVGFVELYYDGQLVLPKMNAATGADTYLKQGLYRNSTIQADGVVYHDGMVPGTSLEDVQDAPAQDSAPATASNDASSNGQPSATPAATSTPAASGGSQPAASAGSSSSSGASSSGSASTLAAAPSGSSAAAGQAQGGCSTSGSTGLSALALGLVAWAIARRQPARVKVRARYRR